MVSNPSVPACPLLLGWMESYIQIHCCERSWTDINFNIEMSSRKRGQNLCFYQVQLTYTALQLFPCEANEKAFAWFQFKLSTFREQLPLLIFIFYFNVYDFLKILPSRFFYLNSLLSLCFTLLSFIILIKDYDLCKYACPKYQKRIPPSPRVKPNRGEHFLSWDWISA